MAATFEWDEHNGAAANVTHGVNQVNWMNVDQPGTPANATLYQTNPITAGNNSFDKWQFGHFSGTNWNQISSGKFAHTGGTFGTGITLKGPPAASTTMLTYPGGGPSQSANGNLVDYTSVTSIDLGLAVYFGPSNPAPSGKSPTVLRSVAGDVVYTNYLTTQLQTTSSAAAGDTATATLTLRYDEN